MYASLRIPSQNLLLRLRLQQECDGTVVNEVDLHICAKTPRLYGYRATAQSACKLFEQRSSLFGRRRRRESGAITT
jgi:predicted DNA-binding protein (UPF0278 family)